MIEYNLFIDENNSIKTIYENLNNTISKSFSFFDKFKNKDRYKLILKEDNEIACFDKKTKKLTSIVVFTTLDQLDNIENKNSFHNIFLRDTINYKYDFLKEILEEKYKCKIVVSTRHNEEIDIFKIESFFKYYIDFHGKNLCKIERYSQFNSFNLKTIPENKKTFNNIEEINKYIINNKKNILNELENEVLKKEESIIYYNSMIDELDKRLSNLDKYFN